jgi:hypothetical protein
MLKRVRHDCSAPSRLCRFELGLVLLGKVKKSRVYRFELETIKNAAHIYKYIYVYTCIYIYMYIYVYIYIYITFENHFFFLVDFTDFS